MSFAGDERIAWCSRCREPAERRLVYDKDGWPISEADPVCERCGNTAELILSAQLHARELSERAQAIATALAGLPKLPERPGRIKSAAPTLAPGARLLSQRETARRLKVGRSDTLPLLVKSGRLHPVPFLGKDKFDESEIERLLREGLPPHATLRAEAASQGKPKRPRRSARETQRSMTLESWRPPSED